MEHQPVEVRVLRWAIVAMVCIGLVSCVAKSADKPKNPVLKAPARQAVPGFGEIAFHVDTVPTVPRCALLADTPAQQQRGLMDRTDLAGYDGMIFRYSAPVTEQFYMFHTLIPLSIAWFDNDGAFVSQTDMEPCKATNPQQCPLFSAKGPYRYAIEVQKGALGGLGIGAGSHLVLQSSSCS